MSSGLQVRVWVSMGTAGPLLGSRWEQFCSFIQRELGVSELRPGAWPSPLSPVTSILRPSALWREASRQGLASVQGVCARGRSGQRDGAASTGRDSGVRAGPQACEVWRVSVEMGLGVGVGLPKTPSSTG